MELGQELRHYPLYKKALLLELHDKQLELVGPKVKKKKLNFKLKIMI